MAHLPAPKQILAPSFFPQYFDDSNRILDWEDIVTLIRNDKPLEASTLLARQKYQEGNKKSYDYIKRLSSSIAPACQIVGKRSLDNAVALSGVACDELYASTRHILSMRKLIQVLKAHGYEDWLRGMMIFGKWCFFFNPEGIPNESRRKGECGVGCRV